MMSQERDAIDAIETNDRTQIAKLVAKGYCVNVVGSNGISLLLRAVYRGHANLVEDLLMLGADPNLADGTGISPLMAASSRGNLSIVRLLLSHGSAVNQKDGAGNTALCYAITRGASQCAIVTALIAKGADVNLPSGGITQAPPLFLALNLDAFDIAEVLLSHGAKITATDGNGERIDYYLTPAGKTWLSGWEDMNR